MEKKKTAFNIRLFVVGAVALLAGALITWFIIISTTGFFNRVSGSWDEIKFAYSHPAIVKAVREDYASKSAQLDEGFMKRNVANEKTEEQKLLEQVTAKLDGLK